MEASLVDAPNKLDCRLLPALIAANHLENQNPVLLKLLAGHGFLTAEEFARQLRKGELEVWLFSNQCAALIAWRANTPYGLTAEIMTVCGMLSKCIAAIPVLEQVASSRGANAVMSVGHTGYKKTMQKAGYRTFPKLLMHKVLHDKGSESKTG